LPASGCHILNCLMLDETKIRQQMDQVVDVFKQDIATIRTGRATPALVEGITVSVYGGQQQMKIQEIGTIMVEGARSLVIQVWDKSIVKEVKNGLLKSSLGINPIVDNDRIRLNLPPLTTDQREDYLRLLAKKLEGVKVMIRDIRGENRRQLQDQLQEKELSEDQFHNQEEKLQKLTDDYIKKLEELALAKEKEIKGE